MDLKFLTLSAIQLIGVMIVALLLSAILSMAFVEIIGKSFKSVIESRYYLYTGWNFLRKETKGIKKKIKINFQNFVSIVGVAIGVWALIVVLSVMGGFERDLRIKIIENSPHIIIKNSNVETPLMASLQNWITMDPDIKWSQPYFEDEVMVASPTNMSVNLSLKGIDVDGRFAKEVLSHQIKDGDLLLLKNPEFLVPDRALGLSSEEEKKETVEVIENKNTDEPVMKPISEKVKTSGYKVYPTILLGEELAFSLQVTVGDEIQVILPEGEVSPLGLRPKSKTFRVGGVFNTGMYEFDLKLAYIKFDESKKFFDYGNVPNSLEIRLNDINETDRITEKITRKIDRIIDARDSEFEIITWKDRNRSLFSALKLEKFIMFLILGFIILVAAFNIVGTLMMIILEKTKEIAIIVSLGATRHGILKTFLFLGFSIGFIGTMTGLFLGIISCIFIESVGIQLPKAYYIRTLPVDMRFWELLMISISALALAIIGTIYPARIAGNLNPVEGLRNE